MASSSILANNPIPTTHASTLLNGSKSNTTATTISARKRTYDTALTSSSSTNTKLAIEPNLAIAKEQSKSMLPPASLNDELLSIKVDTETTIKDYTRTVSQTEPDDGEGAVAILNLDTEGSASPVKKKYATPKTLAASPSFSSGSSDIMVSQCLNLN